MHAQGFASFILLLGIAGILVGVHALQAASVPHESFNSQEVRILSAERTQMEQSIDEMIHAQLLHGMLLHEDEIAIRSAIAQQLMQMQSQIPSASSLQQPQIATMQTQSYWDLLAAGQSHGAAPAEIESNSHVLLIPLPQGQTYAEYTYTGGIGGTQILFWKLGNASAETITALPAGYRICASTTDPFLGCEG